MTTLSIRSPRMFAVIMETDEEVSAGLNLFARHIGIDAATFTGVGAINESTLGYFDPGWLLGQH